MDVERVMEYWPGRSREWVLSAFNYYQTFTNEIDELIRIEDETMSLENLKKLFPQLEVFDGYIGTSDATGSH